MKRFFLFATAFFLIASPVLAQTCDPTCTDIFNCKEKIAKCQEAWNQMEVAKKPHADALRKMEADIAAFQNRIKIIGADVARKAIEIARGEKELGGLLSVAGLRAREFYKRSFDANPLLLFLSSGSVGEALRAIAYQHAILTEDKKVITQTAVFVKSIEDKKRTLEKERAALSYLKEETDRRAASVRKLVGEAEAYQSKLSGIIASLTAQQQAILTQKLAGLNLPTSLGAGPLYCTDDRNLDPGFSPAYTFFTYGIPHRVGMNQYGAYGRAKAGQSYQEILRTYFDGITFEKRDKDMRIRVQGYGEKGLDEYLLGVYEMPGDWPIEALKAQVVAARSYALAYTRNGAIEICTTQVCQVYKGGNKGGDWERAVRETEGEVMVRDGQVITAWYSSTDGGYTYRSGDVGWSDRNWTKRLRDASGDIGSFSDLGSRAYDRESPCFYAAQGFRSQYAKSAWLKGEEIADIVNVILLARRDSGTREHLYQTDKPPPGADVWDAARVRDELRSRGVTPYTTISSVSITGVDWGVGRTTQVSVAGDGGANSFDGSEFKDFFNLRAPANIQIVGPLFNVERR